MEVEAAPVKKSRRSLAKVPVAQSVYEMARDRVRKCYELFDHVAVAFSGGKDSTVVLNIAIEVARELGRLPVRTIFWDEECIPVQTVEFMERTRLRPEVALEWLCVPLSIHNSASVEEPNWYPWDEDARDLWTRDKPDNPNVVTYLPGQPLFPKEQRGFHMNNNGYLFDPKVHGQAVMLMGIRAAESMQRTRAVLGRFGESWLQEHDVGALKGTLVKGYIVYDWRTEDIWKAIADFGWDYNEAYDRMNMFGLAPINQRISSPFHVEATKMIPIYAAAYPEILDKMLARVPGAQVAARYGMGELFGRQGQMAEKPKGMPWREWVILQIRNHHPDRQEYLSKRVAGTIRAHFRKTRDPILPAVPHPVTGLSWKFLTKLAIQDDWINRHTPLLMMWDEQTARKKRAAYDAELAKIRAEGRYDEIRP